MKYLILFSIFLIQLSLVISKPIEFFKKDIEAAIIGKTIQKMPDYQITINENDLIYCYMNNYDKTKQGYKVDVKLLTFGNKNGKKNITYLDIEINYNLQKKIISIAITDYREKVIDMVEYANVRAIKKFWEDFKITLLGKDRNKINKIFIDQNNTEYLENKKYVAFLAFSELNYSNYFNWDSDVYGSDTKIDLKKEVSLYCYYPQIFNEEKSDWETLISIHLVKVNNEIKIKSLDIQTGGAEEEPSQPVRSVWR